MYREWQLKEVAEIIWLFYLGINGVEKSNLFE